MSEPVWNKFLTERDRAVFDASGYGTRGGFGKANLIQGNCPLPLQRCNCRSQAGTLLRQGGRFGRGLIGYDRDLSTQFLILIADLGKLGGNTALPLRDSQGYQRLPSIYMLPTLDVDRADLGGGTGIDARNASIIGYDPAHFDGHRIAAEQQERQEQ